MKPNKDFRAKGNNTDPEDVLRKAVKLAPMKKSGKERHQLYNNFDEDDDIELDSYRKRESVLDYFDEEEEED